jgi:uncharacterized protein (TIGR00297 family)
MMLILYNLQIIMTIIHALIIVVMVLCVVTKKLTIPASLTAGVIGFLINLGAGLPGIIMLGTFFVLGILATSHKKELKVVLGEHQPERKPGQVFANGGVAAIMATLLYLDPANNMVYRMMMAASLASATADTLSSELGMVYGQRFYNILTFRKEAKGLDGVISMEGTLSGAAGSLVIALIYALSFGIDAGCIVIFLSGILGNLVDSILGATLERKRFMNNDVVNFSNTLSAALIALFLNYIITN